MNILIGFDGSACARDAIQQLDRAGLPSDAKVHVASAGDAWPSLPKLTDEPTDKTLDHQTSPIVRKARALVAARLAEAHALAEEGSSLVQKRFPSWKVSHAGYAASPPETLIQPPDFTPDLVVVGSHGRSALGRMVMGSVSQSVLAYSKCSVRVSRRHEDSPASSPTRLIIGIDGSANSALAVSAVAQRVWAPGTEVKVVAVLNAKLGSALILPSTPQHPAWLWAGEGDSESWAHHATNVAARDLAAAGLTATTLVGEGDPKTVLVAEAANWVAHCLFLGAKGHNRLERILLGSVTAAVAARAHCSVEVVR